MDRVDSPFPIAMQQMRWHSTAKYTLHIKLNNKAHLLWNNQFSVNNSVDHTIGIVTHRCITTVKPLV